MTDNVHFASDSDEWETPDAIVQWADERWLGGVGFDLDPAATDDNAKASEWFDKDNDGLSQPWYGHVWCNPPYGRQIHRWIEKAAAEAALGRCDVVMLLPARVDTVWWHDLVLAYATAVVFFKGRVKFVGAENSAPFPSVVVYFKAREQPSSASYYTAPVPR